MNQFLRLLEGEYLVAPPHTIRLLQVLGALTVQASAFDALDMMIKEPEEFDRVLKLIAEGKEQEASNALASHFGRAYYGTFGEESDRNTDSNIDQEMQILGVE